MNIDRILRRDEVIARTGLSKSTIRRRELTDPTFPKRVRLGPPGSEAGAVGYRESELATWLNSLNRAEEGAAA